MTAPTGQERAVEDESADASSRRCVCNIGVQECPVHPGRLLSKEEKIQFRKNWDSKVQPS